MTHSRYILYATTSANSGFMFYMLRPFRVLVVPLYNMCASVSRMLCCHVSQPVFFRDKGGAAPAIGQYCTIVPFIWAAGHHETAEESHKNFCFVAAFRSFEHNVIATSFVGIQFPNWLKYHLMRKGNINSEKFSKKSAAVCRVCSNDRILILGHQLTVN